ncbi:MAG: hypothetical protein K0R92_1872 [Lachnospiraceae bacterium]|jgi:hypothetical protein|nr:hypothetical protein [Lachnospiraceae bacterium]
MLKSKTVNTSPQKTQSREIRCPKTTNSWLNFFEAK